MNLEKTIVERADRLARGIADWLCEVQYPIADSEPRSGSIPFCIFHDGTWSATNQWNVAFAVMGWLAAHKAYGERKYLEAALAGGKYLKSLQVFDPFNKQHYGAIREQAPQTPWCYPRDSISAGWAFIELYRATGDAEYLSRAELLGEWFLREAFDKDGWPYWGVQLEDLFDPENPPQICNDVQGCFHGGTLNYFYQLGKASGDAKWTGDFFVKMADYFVDHIQQPDGFFRSIETATRKPPKDDPQRGLHRANDDLGTLGLLCAYKVTGDEKYLRAIDKFIAAVFAKQDDEGMFEESVACIPVIFNTLQEAGDLIDASPATDAKIEKAFDALFAAQISDESNKDKFGALLEEPRKPNPYVCARSNCYALIVSLKLSAGIDYLLTT